MRPEDRRGPAPRCPACGRFMEVEAELERVQQYACCGNVSVRFKTEFHVPEEEYA